MADGLCVASLPVTLHRQQPLLQLSSLLLVFGLIAAIKSLNKSQPFDSLR